MSDVSAALRDIVARLEPIHETIERGLTPKELERLRNDLIDLEDDILEIEGEIEALKFAEFEAELERAEAAKAIAGATP